VAQPNQKSAGKTTESLAELLDVYPTLVELCGLPKVAGLEGVSLAPVLGSPRKSVRTAALTQHPRPAYYQGSPDTMGYSVRTGRFRYTEWREWKTGQTVARELYDHGADPAETRNLATESGWERAVAECAEQLSRLNPAGV